MPKTYDVAIIGSGAAGTVAAYPLVRAGLRVVMVDGGIQSPSILDAFPQISFEEFRTTSLSQRQIFFGDDLSALHGLKGSHSKQMTGGLKSYVTDLAEKLLPLKHSSYSLLQSLARGGLTEAWGGACDFFSSAELTGIGLPAQEMKKYYQKVCDLIGISGVSTQYHLQPPITLDNHGELLLQRARKEKQVLQRHFLRLYQPALAILTKRKKDRQATHYTDLEYWVNPGKSVFKPRYLIDELQQFPHFSYQPGYVVEEIIEKKNQAAIKCHHLRDATQHTTFHAKKVILAAGSINSTRIALRSLHIRNTPVPLFVKPHLIVPCFHTQTLGKAGLRKRVSLCQLVLNYTPDKTSVSQAYAQLYSYKSLLLYKLLANVPLPTPLALRFLRFFTPTLVLADTRFITFTDQAGQMFLRSDRSKKTLEIIYPDPESIFRLHRGSYQKILFGLRKLGLIPLKPTHMPTGSTAHYAGGMPASLTSESSNSPLTTSLQGKLHQMKHVFVADASTWRMLPAKAPTLTIMANAYRVGEAVSQLF